MEQAAGWRGLFLQQDGGAQGYCPRKEKNLKLGWPKLADAGASASDLGSADEKNLADLIFLKGLGQQRPRDFEIGRPKGIRVGQKGQMVTLRYSSQV